MLTTVVKLSDVTDNTTTRNRENNVGAKTQHSLKSMTYDKWIRHNSTSRNHEIPERIWQWSQGSRCSEAKSTGPICSRCHCTGSLDVWQFSFKLQLGEYHVDLGVTKPLLGFCCVSDKQATWRHSSLSLERVALSSLVSHVRQIVRSHWLRARATVCYQQRSVCLIP